MLGDLFGSLTKDKLIVYFLLCAGCFTISFNVAAIAAAVPSISRDLILDDFRVAKIIPYYLIPYGFGALLYAPLTRFFSYRIVYVVTMALYGLACCVCAGSDHLQTILAGRIAMGITGSAAIPLGLMIIGEFFNKKVRGRLVGIFFSHAFVASIAGLMTAGIADWPWLFYVPAGLSWALVVGFIIDRNTILSRKHAGHINYLKVLAKPEVLKIFCFIFAISFFYHGVHKWYGVYLSQVYHLDKLTISFFFILTVVGGLVGQLTGGVLSDKKGRLFTCLTGILGLGFSTTLLYGSYPKFILGLVLLFISIFWTIGHNGISTVLTDFSDEDRPVIASLNSSIRFLSGGLGFALSSFFVAKSFTATFLTIGLLTLLLSFAIKKIVPIDTSREI